MAVQSFKRWRSYYYKRVIDCLKLYNKNEFLFLLCDSAPLREIIARKGAEPQGLYIRNQLRNF
jgi:ADP-heptose:LPS heptosyltransferase